MEVVLENQRLQFCFFFLLDFAIWDPAHLEELTHAFPDEFLDALVGFEVGGDLDYLHDLEVEVVGGVEVEGLEDGSKAVDRLHLDAAEDAVDYQLAEVV